MHAGPRSGAAGGKAGNLAEHLRYLQREDAEAGEGRPTFFTADAAREPERAVIVKSWALDRHHYRLIVSPEAGHGLASIEAYTRDLMRDVSQHLGRELEWVGAIHTNTDQVHAHVALRGVADGKELRLFRAAVSTDIRTLAQERATAELGPRTLDQVREAYQREAQAAGVTGLDRVLDRVQDAGRIDLATAPTNDTIRPHLAGRLQHLERMGLAKRRGARVFRVEPDFLNVLRQSQERERIGTEVRRVAGAEAPVTRRCCGEPPETPVIGEVVAAGLTRGGQHGFVLLREKVGLVYAEVPAHAAPHVRAGGLVSLEDGGRHWADAGLALRLDGDRIGTEHPEGSEAGRESERRRLAFLVNRGLAVEQEGGHRLDPAAAARLRAGGGAEPPRVSARVLLVEAPERYVDSPAWTPLDRILSGRETPAWPGAEAWAGRRGERLGERGLAERDPAGAAGGWRFTPGAVRALRDAELDAATADAAAEHGATPARLRAPRAADAEVLGSVGLHQGRGLVLRHAGGVSVEAHPAGAALQVGDVVVAESVRGRVSVRLAAERADDERGRA
ncbi:DUF3363 domain-containing protein [Phycisphaera mikurensis]|nr:DUF3363 domain-containing protein [Phycisphaera mikurensis]